MRLVARTVIVLLMLWLLPVRASGASSTASFRFLSAGERSEITHAARLAARSRTGAVRWLRSRNNVGTVRLSLDGVTIEIAFKDGAVGAVFGSVSHVRNLAGRTTAMPLSQIRPDSVSRAGGTAQAIVLEPFGSDLGLGPQSGKPEIDALTQAGFQVSAFRDKHVTIPIIESMGANSVVYLESHSGICGPPLCSQSDVFVLTNEQDGSPYINLFADHSLVQGAPENDPGNLVIGFTSQLVRKHMQTFPSSSMVFINGCSVLATPTFAQALTDRGVSTLFTWDKKVNNPDAEAAADFIFPRLASGDTAAQALAEAHNAGVDSKQSEDGQTTLTLLGDSENTFAKALARATPTPAPTGVATPTPTLKPGETPSPTPTPQSLAPIKRLCKTGCAFSNAGGSPSTAT